MIVEIQAPHLCLVLAIVYVMGMTAGWALATPSWKKTLTSTPSAEDAPKSEN